MDKKFLKKGLISLKDLNKEEIELLLQKAEEIKKRPPGPVLQGKILANLFFEPSTRTRLSFETAMKKLGGECIGFSGSESTSINKGESLFDTIRVVSLYADAIVIRHPYEGSAKLALEASQVPVINGGDGANEHPTQTLLDLFTIQETQGKLNKLNIVLAGDLKYSRTIHSLALALSHFEPRLFFVSPKGLEIDESICSFLKAHQILYSFHNSLEEVLFKADILYMTRIQKERFLDPFDYERVKNSFMIDKKTLKGVKDTFRILHPLPRIHEISNEVDETSYASYFAQAVNGIFVRQALIMAILLEGFV